jgi:hypothetical protein
MRRFTLAGQESRATSVHGDGMSWWQPTVRRQVAARPILRGATAPARTKTVCVEHSQNALMASSQQRHAGQGRSGFRQQRSSPRVTVRRWSAVVIMLACIELCGVGPAAAAPSADPPPRDCVPGVAAVVCAIGGTPGQPGGGRSPRPTPAGSPQPSTSAHPAPRANPPGSAVVPPSASPSPAPDSTLAQLGGSLRSATYLGQLVDALAHPAAAGRPDLRHFPLPRAAAPATAPLRLGRPGGTPPAGDPGHGGRLVEEALVALAAAGLMLGLVRWRSSAPRTRRWTFALAVVLTLPVSTDATVRARHHPSAPAPLPHASAPRLATAPATLPPPAASGLWGQLLDIERRLGDGSVPLAEHHQDLQAEYELYRSAARDPGQRATLTAAAARFSTPDALIAVTANLGVVTVQLAQEAALTEAQARLRELGTLLPLQMDAIHRHRPFITPEVAPVSQGFGPSDLSIEPPLLYKGSFYPHFHTGIDLAAPENTPLHAAADGVVLVAAASVDPGGRLVGYGNYVVIGHAAGFLTLYGHLSIAAVHSGDRVRQGQVIGFEGSTGNSTGPHVHFEIRQDGALLDPAPFLTGQLPPG